MRLNRALFLDLDGTIVETRSGERHPAAVEDYKFKNNILKKLRYYSDNGFIIIIVFNQGGISQGHTTMEFVQDRVDMIAKEIETYIHAAVPYSFCPDMEGYDRKPNPGMAYKMAIYHDLNLSESIMVGDGKSDEEFAETAGIGSYMYVTDFTKDYR